MFFISNIEQHNRSNLWFQVCHYDCWLRFLDAQWPRIYLQLNLSKQEFKIAVWYCFCEYQFLLYLLISPSPSLSRNLGSHVLCYARKCFTHVPHLQVLHAFGHHLAVVFLYCLPPLGHCWWNRSNTLLTRRHDYWWVWLKWCWLLNWISLRLIVAG